jgi:putative ABC transport system ATP-binding protein
MPATAPAPPPRGGVAVRVTDVTKTFPLGSGRRLTAIGGVSLTVEPGAAVAIIGPSGSGKSTLLHLIGGIERPDAGTVEVNGQELTVLPQGRLADHRRRVGFVFQRYHLLPALTARDNVLVPVLPYRTRFDKDARASELLAAVGLDGKEGALPSRLSGGEQQRVAIARALVNDPPLLLADEPTGNLDSRTGGEIVDLLVRLRDERGTTILIATHNPRVAARCDLLVRLRDGQIVKQLDLTGIASPEDTLRRIDRLG